MQFSVSILDEQLNTQSHKYIQNIIALKGGGGRGNERLMGLQGYAKMLRFD